MAPERGEPNSHKAEASQDRRIMPPQSIPNVVPACPGGLGFRREDFLRADFTVDSFLSRAMGSGSDVGLERLRDDLGVYLKVRLATWSLFVISPPPLYIRE